MYEWQVSYIQRLVMGRPGVEPTWGWAGPVDHFFMWWAEAPPGPSKFQLVGRGPARPIKLAIGGARPGPVHQIFIWLGPLTLHLMSHGPARLIQFSNCPGPGSAYQFFKFVGPTRPGL